MIRDAIYSDLAFSDGSVPLVPTFRILRSDEDYPLRMSPPDVTLVNCCQVPPAWMRGSKFGASSFGPVSNWSDLRSRGFLNAPANSLILRASTECECNNDKRIKELREVLRNAQER